MFLFSHSTLFSFFIAVTSSIVVPVARGLHSYWDGDSQPIQSDDELKHLIHWWDLTLVFFSLFVYAVLHVWFLMTAHSTRRTVGRDLVHLPADKQWACFQFMETFFEHMK